MNKDQILKVVSKLPTEEGIAAFRYWESGLVKKDDIYCRKCRGFKTRTSIRLPRKGNWDSYRCADCFKRKSVTI